MIAVTSGFAVWGAVAAVLVLLGLALHVRRRRRVALALGDPELTTRLIGQDLRRTPWARITLVAAGAIAVAAALADPRWGDAAPQDVRGGPLVIVFDVSNSMLAADLEPDRLERGRAAAHAVATAAAGAPVGIVAFAGRAYALSPPTTDPGAVDLYLAALHPDMVTQTGSSLSAAVRQGLALLLATDAPDGGTLVVISDGDTEEPVDSLRAVIGLAERAGVPVFTLGAGTARGAAVPGVDRETGRRTGPMRTPEGELVMSRLEDAFLRELAERTGGQYLPLSQPNADSWIRERIADRPASAAVVGAAGAAPERYAWFAGLALVLLGLEAVLRRREPA